MKLLPFIAALVLIALSQYLASCIPTNRSRSTEIKSHIDSIYLPKLVLIDTSFQSVLDTLINFSKEQVTKDVFNNGYLSITCISPEHNKGMFSIYIGELRDVIIFKDFSDKPLTDFVLGAFYYKEALVLVKLCTKNQVLLPFEVTEELLILKDTDNFFDSKYNLGSVLFINNTYKVVYDFYPTFIIYKE